MSRARIAICFFGITRSLGYTIGSIEENILAPARRRGEVMVFSHFFEQVRISNPRSGETGALDPGEHRLLPNDWLRLEKPDACLERWNFAGLKGHGDFWGDDFRSLRNLVHQLHSLRQVTQAALAAAPDLVLFCRPDLLYHDTFDDRIAAALATTWPGIELPAWQSWGGCNDRFALARGPRAAAAYGTRIEVAETFCRRHQMPMHSERLLAYALRRRLVPVREIEIRASRMRANGEQKIENFAKPPPDALPMKVFRRAKLLMRDTGLTARIRS